MDKTAQGAHAEQRAAAYLKARGLKLVARNWRCRFGEIDLILQEGATLVFVEVRARRGADFGGAAQSITAAKRARLTRTAEAYLAQTGHRGPCRFDAILIEGERLTWLRDAFAAEG
ncbi:MAG: YraN family protein [Thiobacillaceae bacterium]